MTPQIKQRIAQIQKGEIPTGYKKTDVGIVPCEWKVDKILNVAPLQRGFDLPTQNIVAGLYPIVYSNGINGKHVTFKVKAPGVVTGRSGTIGKVIYVEENYWPHNTSLWVTDFKNNIARFIYYKFQKLNFSKLDSGSGVPTLNRNDVHCEKIAYPTSKTEQNRIAEILLTQDKHIELQEKLIAQKQEQKKYLMQVLLTGKQRLKGVKGEWERIKFNKLCYFVSSGKNKNKSDTGVYPVYGSTGIIGNTEKYVYDYPVILIARVGANAGKIYKVFGKFDVSDNTLIVRIKSEYHFYFIYYLLLKEDLNKYVFGSGQPLVTSGQLKNLNIFIPKKFDEQEAIAEILTTSDKEIELLKKQLEHEKQRKKSLMQLLLTGIVRV